jgi:hypothetical protein
MTTSNVSGLPLPVSPLPPPCPSFVKGELGHVAMWHEGAEHWAALRYWHAHESWEVIWRNADATHAPTIRACIQLAAALYKPFQADRLRAANKPECTGLVHGMRRLLDRAKSAFDHELDPELSSWFEREWRRANAQCQAWNQKKTLAPSS